MAKIRLNQDKREVLMRLALQAVEDTPIDSAIEKRKANALKAYDKLFDKLAAAGNAALSKTLPEDEVKVLRKHNMITSSLGILVIDLDSRNTFTISLFNQAQYFRIHGKVEDKSFEEAQKYRNDLVNHKESLEATVVANGLGYTRPVGCTSKVNKLHLQLQDAKNEMDIALSADKERRAGIKADFSALISTARNFEDVVAVWPEAKEVTDQIVGMSQQVSLMSTDAVTRIQANMASRGAG